MIFGAVNFIMLEYWTRLCFLVSQQILRSQSWAFLITFDFQIGYNLGIPDFPELCPLHHVLRMYGLIVVFLFGPILGGTIYQAARETARDARRREDINIKNS